MKPAVEWGSAWKKGNRKCGLTLARRVPSFLLPLAPAVGGCCIDREAVEERGATGRLVPTPTAGEMERGGTFGGGPGSPAPGERRCELRVEFISGLLSPPGVSRRLLLALLVGTVYF